MNISEILIFRRILNTIITASEAQSVTSTIVEGGSSLDNVEPLKNILKDISKLVHKKELQFNNLNKEEIRILATVGDIVATPYSYNIKQGTFIFN